MRKIEHAGIGVHVEVYVLDHKTDIEAMKEAVKTLQKEIIRHESRVSRAADITSNDNVL